jgi:hypothetical protein
MHLLQIPRAVVVMAGGNYSGATNDDGQAVIEVAAEIKPRQSLSHYPWLKRPARGRSARKSH